MSIFQKFLNICAKISGLVMLIIYTISGASQGANHGKALLIHPFDPQKGVLQMDSLNNVNVECKDCDRSVCFVVGCNNSATMSVRIELNDRIDALICVCQSCLPVIQSNQTHIMKAKKMSHSDISDPRDRVLFDWESTRRRRSA